MNAPPFPIDPELGQWWQNWIWNGARWVAAPTTGLRILTQRFSASGAYMPSPGLASVMVECIGGGGGGGAAGSPGVTFVVSGGGGGSGGYSRSTLPAALVRGGVLVTVGQGGLAAQGGDTPNGGQGGQTLFGALVVANGGFGGNGNDGGPGSLWGYPGNGADAGIGEVVFPGDSGGVGSLIQNATVLLTAYGAGKGGQLFGGGQTTYAATGGGATGLDGWGNTGGGGSGGIINQGPDSLAAGGNGGSGVCIVTEFCWGDRDQPFCEVPAFNLNANLVMGPPQPPWCPPGPPGPPRPPGPWPREYEQWDDPNALSDS